MNFFNKAATILLLSTFAINALTASDEPCIVEQINDKVADTFSIEKREKIVNQLKAKLNKKGEKMKLIKKVKETEKEIAEYIGQADKLLIKEIKGGTIIDTIDQAVANLTSEESRLKVMESLKDAFDEEKEEEIRNQIINSEFTDKQKTALLELIDMLHCETSKMPVD